jgi:hypothetical protein
VGTRVPSPASPQLPGTSVTWTAAASGGSGTYEYKFDLWDGSSFSTVQSYGASATWTWNTTGLALGNYSVQVQARSAGSIASYEAVQIVPYTLVGSLPSGTTVSLTPSPASPQPPGTSVVWTASASGGSAPYQYEFWLEDPNESMSLAQAYSASNTFTWDTTGLAGTYKMRVLVRNAGTSVGWDATQTVPFFVITPATGVTVSISPASPQDAGTSVTWTATASGGSGTYQYQFWLYSNNSWSIVRPYSTSDTWIWDTSGFPLGEYAVWVEARNNGSSADYEANSGSLPFYLQGSPAARSVTLTASPDSPRAPGTPVTFAATATGTGGLYQYQFWLSPGLTPDGDEIWSIVQPYSTTNTWVWDTTGVLPGTYKIVVWAKYAGSTVAMEADATVTYIIQ